MDTISEGSSHLVQKNMRMGVTIHLYTHFLVQLYHIVPHL